MSKIIYSNKKIEGQRLLTDEHLFKLSSDWSICYNNPHGKGVSTNIHTHFRIVGITLTTYRVCWITDNNYTSFVGYGDSVREAYHDALHTERLHHRKELYNVAVDLNNMLSDDLDRLCYPDDWLLMHKLLKLQGMLEDGLHSLYE